MPEWLHSAVIEAVPNDQVPLLTEPVILAIIGLAGIAITAWLTYLGVKAGHDRARQDSDRQRVAAVEARLETTEKQNIGLWAYCRALIDHIYKGGGAPPPDPPHTIMDLFD